ncbi:apolipoprotein N-acyltransferase [Noviherbaspirillum autotrophicum]|uniref:Apolipoprotein N-acyltransferase n=1 Tax=Noviherbaspirillum autotrophicum TaxID=709839 RepID=A0A0C1YIY7_9BURK|nr:apolipoprotein N-acyltransferase [Noviherbaspirillum autotrophicum]KIF80432.1 apolipoprotein acyltransferase [Noviherbaspirillum autotrophicum]
MALFTHSSMRILAAILASAVMSGLYARGGAGWLLGFVFLVPWLRTLDAIRTRAGALLSGWAMSVAFTAAAGAWFGAAIGTYTQIGAAAGLSLLLFAAPLFQPQFLAFALVRLVAGRRYGPVVGAFAGAAAWVAMEWLTFQLLGNALGYTLGYGLYPSRLLRQAADVGGTAGLTVMLLLANEGVAAALARRTDGVRAMTKLLALAALVPLLLAGYGLIILSALPTSAGKPLRIGMVQSNIVDYERQRQEKGAHAVVREVLDTHFAMTYDAVARQHADAVLWSETVFPTTFGHPKSAAGAEFDREIIDIVNSAGVPFVFGTYDRDADGEYNAAAFVEPGAGILGYYRKTRLFPLTEYVPAWLDGAALRRWLPWAGTWQPGTGARVFPLRLSDGREIPVQPMICLDSMDTGLAIDGARLGAQAILTMSNDSWFADGPGKELLHAAAAFRSIETRLPQFRVTQNGYSAVIDATGTVLAGARKDERMLVVGSVPVGAPPRTLMVTLGNWVGLAGVILLVLLAAAAFARLRTRQAQEAPEPAVAMTFPVNVAVLPPAARLAAGLLRAFARGSLLWMCAAMLLSDALRGHTLAQIRTFAGLFIFPEVASWCVLYAFAARASIENGTLVLARGARRMELAVRDIVAIEPWRVPLPGPGASLRLASGKRWSYGIALADTAALARALASVGSASVRVRASSRATTYAKARLAIRRGRLDHPFAKFVLFPITLAIPAFHLHQHIAFGSGLGEYTMFGLKAYLTAFSLWWASWAIAVVLIAAALRAAIEAGTLLAVALRPGQATEVRRWLERFGLAALYLGLPSWLLLRVYGG